MTTVLCGIMKRSVRLTYLNLESRFCCIISVLLYFIVIMCYVSPFVYVVFILDCSQNRLPKALPVIVLLYCIFVF